jgi:hypothetical protein
MYVWVPRSWVWAWEYVRVVLLIQKSTHMWHIVTSFMAPLAAPYFLTLSYERRVCRITVTEHKIFALILSKTLSKIVHIQRRMQRDMIINVKSLHVKYMLFLSNFNETWIFWTGFRKKFKYQISSKSVQWKPSCSMRTEGQTYGHDEANIRFS